MPPIPQKPQTEGSLTFDPAEFFKAWEKEEIKPPQNSDFFHFMLHAFGLRSSDDYTYRATAEVTLAQVQTYLEHGGVGRLHEWYLDDQGKQKPAPPVADIVAYTDIFSSKTSTQKATVALGSNAKKDSIRAAVAAHLKANYEPPSADRKITVPKLKKAHVNPYYDVWRWSCENLEWAGPEAGTKNVRISHALLPVLYHHFGCIVPSYESLEIIKQVSKGRTIIDLGSGNGYWTYMLRRMGDEKRPVKVVPVDSGSSEWRTMWIGDTIMADGIKYLQQHQDGRDQVLLLVYPQVGADFTGKVLRAYKGDTIIVAGTQNTNGFTAFAKETIAQWMAREMPAFEKVLQIPLPSFAGKDEALFVFNKS
ncbi:hypothetical protein MBLNU457_g0586t1 [Dothideomycetes sp. NU457]